MFNALQSIRPQIDPRSLSNKTLTSFLYEYIPPKTGEGANPKPQVLVFDQLEELFTFYPDKGLIKWRQQQEDFFRQVAEALEKNSMLRIVFVIREYFLAQLDPFTRLLPGKLRSRFRMEALRTDAAFQAILGPLRNSEYKVDEVLVHKIVDDLMKVHVETVTGKSVELAGDFIEPIQLQVVCQKLWQGNLSLSTQDSGLIGNVDVILGDFYENAIRDAVVQTGVNEGDVRVWCEKTLITATGTRSIVHREAGTTGGMPNQVIDILEKRYLIRGEWRAGARWYELIHDRLIEPIKDSNRKWAYEREREAMRAMTMRMMTKRYSLKSFIKRLYRRGGQV